VNSDVLAIKISPDMVSTVNNKQVPIASFPLEYPMPAARLIIIFQFMVRGGDIE
jgi:hypothetical protein